jgi:hypothetical protein
LQPVPHQFLFYALESIFFNFLPRVKIPSAEKLLRFISHWFENFFTDTGFCQVPGFSIRQQFLTGIRQVLPFNP